MSRNDSRGELRPDPSEVELIFDSALERPIEERPAFLDAACAGDHPLRSRVERLLRCFQDRGDLLDLPPIMALDERDEDSAAPESGQRVGSYELIRPLASGGMGTVWLARRADEHFQKDVALKLIKRGMDTDAILARFRTERQVLASLEHPNIARLLDGGATEGGRPYLVMEYVDGLPIDRFCDENQLPISERLRLFRTMLTAVQFAHQNLVVHRDLKPGNILVSPDGAPKLVDFGIAKLLQPVGSDGPTVATAPQLRVMTPRYASPEQVRGERIGTASDIYSLGVVLYELLTGREPYVLATRSRAEYESAILEQEPQRPSAALGRRPGLDDASTSRPPPSSARDADSKRLRRRLAGDLDMIVLKALRKEPARRYSTVEQFSEDIRRHLEHLPILARPDSWSYRARKMAARNPHLVAATAIVAAAMLTATGVSIDFGRSEARQRALAVENMHRAEVAEGRAGQERDTAKLERNRAVAMTDFLIRAMQSHDPAESGRQDIRVSEAMQRAVDLLDRGDLSDQPATVAALLHATSTILDNAGRGEEAERLASRALDMRKGLYAADHVDIAESLITEGRCLVSLGRLTDALSIFESALEMSRRLFPAGEHQSVATSLTDAGACLASLGRPAEALTRYEEALRIARCLGDEREIAGALNNVARALQLMGRFSEALSNFEASADMLQRLVPGDHPDRAMSLTNIALCLQALGRSSEALPSYEAALEMYQRLFQGDHPSVGKGLTSLASCLNSLGRTDEALPKYQAALEILRRLHPADHPDVALCLNNLGSCHTALGMRADAGGDSGTARREREEALAYSQAALEMRQRLFTGDHPDVALSLSNVASCTLVQGRYDEALPQYRAALGMYQNLFDGDHPDVARGLNNVAFCLYSAGRPADAIPEYEAALAMYQRIFDEPHPDLAKAYSHLADCQQSLGRLEESVHNHTMAWRVYRSCLDGDHVTLVRAQSRVAHVLRLLGRPADALTEYEAALQMSQRLFKGDHPDVARGMTSLGICLNALGRSDEALPHCEKALQMYQRLFNGDHAELAAALNNVAVCQLSLCRPAEALEMQEAALEMRQRLFKGDHRDVATNLWSAAICLLELDRPDEARRLLERAFDMCRRLLPSGHTDIEGIRADMGVALADLARFDEAEPLLLEALAALDGNATAALGPKRRGWQALVKLYEAKHAAEPSKGFDAKAAECLAKLADLPATSQPAAGSKQH